MRAHVRHSFLLLEGEPRFATGFTAFGLKQAAPGTAQEAVTSEADVIELCCALLVDEQLSAKPLLCSQPVDTTRTLVQLTALLAQLFEDTPDDELLKLDKARKRHGVSS